jgi:hypothetical protein
MIDAFNGSAAGLFVGYALNQKEKEQQTITPDGMRAPLLDIQNWAVA